MKRRQLTMLTGVIAAFALAQSAQAIDIGIGGGGGVRVGVGGGGVQVGVGGGSGGGGSGVRVGVASTGDGATTAKVNVGSTSATATLGGASTADVNIGVGGRRGTVHATVDLNGDGVIDGKDDVLLALDINGDGTLNLLDDTDGDGVLAKGDIRLDLNGSDRRVGAKVDLGGGVGGAGAGNASVEANIDLGDAAGLVDVGGLDIGGLDIGGLPDVSGVGLPPVSVDIGGIGIAPPAPGVTPSPIPVPGPGPNPEPDPIPGVTVSDTEQTLRRLDDNEIPALKIKCVDVLRNPAGFEATMVQICRVAAKL